MNNKVYVACCGNPDDDYVSGVYLNEDNVKAWFKQAVTDMLEMMQESGALYKINLYSDTDFHIEDKDGCVYYVRWESSDIEDAE